MIEIEEGSEYTDIRFEMPTKLFKAMTWYCLMDTTPNIEEYLVRCVRKDLESRVSSDWDEVVDDLNKSLKKLLEA